MIRVVFSCSLALALAMALPGCASTPAGKDAALPQAAPALQFLDGGSFDRSLSSSLGAALPRVEVSFYDRITPSALPERIQKWMAAVQSQGGEVKVTPPPSTVAAKNPLLLISAVSTLWSASTMARDAAAEARFAPAHKYNAEVMLKVDERGDTVVDKLVFSQRGK